MAGIADFIFGRSALKKAVASTQEEDDEVRKKKKQDEPEAVPVNASDAAAMAQARLKQEALKKAVKTRAKGAYK